MKIDKYTAKCFAVLSTHDFKPLVGYLEGMRTISLQQLTKADEPVVIHRLQGQVALLDSLLASIHTGRETLDKLERH